MLELKNPRIAVPVVLFAGILWSFGPLVVRYMDNPNLVPWQYIFGRGLTIFIILNFIFTLKRVRIFGKII
jgi:DME family drug/metabolite transporter